MPPEVIQALINYGSLGIVVLAAATGFIYFKPHVDQLRDSLVDCRNELREARVELKEARDEIRKDAEIMREVLMPAVTQSTAMIQRIQDELWRWGRGNVA